MLMGWPTRLGGQLACGTRYSITYSTTQPATFPWHCEHHVQSIISQQHHKMVTQEEGRIDLARSAYVSGQFTSVRRADAAYSGSLINYVKLRLDSRHDQTAKSLL